MGAGRVLRAQEEGCKSEDEADAGVVQEGDLGVEAFFCCWWGWSVGAVWIAIVTAHFLLEANQNRKDLRGDGASGDSACVMYTMSILGSPPFNGCSSSYFLICAHMASTSLISARSWALMNRHSEPGLVERTSASRASAREALRPTM